jgi:SNF2 family DNA or RNA helicase
VERLSRLKHWQLWKRDKTMSDLDDFFANIFDGAEPAKPAKEEPVSEAPTEEVKKIVLSGEFFDPEDKVIEDGIWAGMTVEEVAAEYGQEEPVEPVVLSPVDIAKAAVEAANQREEEARAKFQAVKDEYAAMEEMMRVMRQKFADANTEYREVANDKHAAQRKLTEAEFIAQEEAKEAEIQKEKRVLVEGYRKKVEELDPAWRNGAYDHQWEGATTLALHGSALLGDEMGLGKSLTALMVLDFIDAHRTLIVAPNGTVENLTLEAMRWSPHRFTFPMAGSDNATRTALLNTIFRRRFEQGKDFIMTVNFEQLRNAEFVEQLRELQFDTIIVDEADGFKDKSSGLYKSLYRLRYAANKLEENGELSCSVKHFYPMTGTFIRNKPADIWPALNLVDKEAFPVEREFLLTYCTYDSYDGKWNFRTGGVSSLIKRLGGRIVMRTTVECGIIIPEQILHDENPAHLEVCEECRTEFPIRFMDGEYGDQRRIMKQLAEHSQIILDSERKTSTMEQLAIITRNRQAVVWPGGIKLTGEHADGSKFEFSVGEDVNESIKVDWVERKIRALRAKGKRVVVFSQFKDGIKELESRLRDQRVVRYDGDTPSDIKSRVMQDFDRRVVADRGNEWEWDIVLCNFKTGGVGLNFTHATDTILLDEYWNPAGNEQAFRRTKRMGQTEVTHVWIPRVARTIDTCMKNLNDDKRAMVDGFNLEVDMEKNLTDFLSIMKGDL